jgi:guanosine-3',5'-bis(diphosphate) 3'-pyrophosphohydrolase
MRVDVNRYVSIQTRVDESGACAKTMNAVLPKIRFSMSQTRRIAGGATMVYSRYLVRHGSTSLRVSSVSDGRFDPPLSRQGAVQADHVAAAVAALELSHDNHLVISSPMQRAVRTARSFARVLRCPIVKQEGFLERGWGKRLQIREEALPQTNLEKASPSVEPERDFENRVQRAWMELPSETRVIVVSHADVLESLLKFLGQTPVHMQTGGVVRLIEDSAGWIVSGPVVILDKPVGEVPFPSGPLEFARQKHSRQKRASGAPYIEHLERVARRVTMAGFTDDTIMSAALLHDTLEDTNTTKQELRNHFGADVADLVASLTLAPGVPFDEQARRYYQQILSFGTPSTAIKLADIIDNLTDIEAIPEWRSVRMAKRAREFLQETNCAPNVPLLGIELMTLKAQLAKAIVQVESQTEIE